MPLLYLLCDSLKVLTFPNSAVTISYHVLLLYPHVRVLSADCTVHLCAMKYTNDPYILEHNGNYFVTKYHQVVFMLTLLCCTPCELPVPPGLHKSSRSGDAGRWRAGDRHVHHRLHGHQPTDTAGS